MEARCDACTFFPGRGPAPGRGDDRTEFLELPDSHDRLGMGHATHRHRDDRRRPGRGPEASFGVPSLLCPGPMVAGHRGLGRV